MKWNLRMKAAERGIWKSVELRRLLADAGLEISAGKMSALWTTTPTTVRLSDLDVICTVLDCSPADLLIVEPDAVAAARPAAAKASNGGDQPDPPAPNSPPKVTPRLGRNRTLPPA
jgi:putative transcriptional regulator